MLISPKRPMQSFTDAAVRALAAALLFCAAACAQSNIWQLTPTQRQQLLAAQEQQLQLSQQQQASLQQAIQQARFAQQQAQAQETSAMMNSVVDRYNADNAASDMVSSATISGLNQAEAQGNLQNLKIDIAQIRGVVQNWQPPRAYRGRARLVPLLDPFAPAGAAAQPAAVAADAGDLAKALVGTCLALDAQNGVARVAGDCYGAGGRIAFPAGSYPVLPGGIMIDSAAKVALFRQALASRATRWFALDQSGLNLMPIR